MTTLNPGFYQTHLLIPHKQLRLAQVLLSPESLATEPFQRLVTLARERLSQVREVLPVHILKTLSENPFRLGWKDYKESTRHIKAPHETLLVG